MAEIQLVFRPIPKSGSFSLPGYHEFILYTDDSGQMFYIRGGPDGNTQSSFIFGNLSVTFGAYAAKTPDFPVLPNTSELDSATLNSWYKITLHSGPQPQMDPIWNTYMASAQQVQQYLETNPHPYEALSQNSDSAASQVIRVSGDAAPNTELFSGNGIPYGGAFNVAVGSRIVKSPRNA